MRSEVICHFQLSTPCPCFLIWPGGKLKLSQTLRETPFLLSRTTTQSGGTL